VETLFFIATSQFSLRQIMIIFSIFRHKGIKEDHAGLLANMVYIAGLETPKSNSGAGDGNRTHVTSLEGWSSTIELHPHEVVVGAAGFEPATPCSQGRCSTKLSHAPQTAKCIIL
jgi:hypothetical protein